jgi:hypothetical protein
VSKVPIFSPNFSAKIILKIPDHTGWNSHSWERLLVFPGAGSLGLPLVPDGGDEEPEDVLLAWITWIWSKAITVIPYVFHNPIFEPFFGKYLSHK